VRLHLFFNRLLCARGLNYGVHVVADPAARLLAAQILSDGLGAWLEARAPKRRAARATERRRWPVAIIGALLVIGLAAFLSQSFWLTLVVAVIAVGAALPWLGSASAALLGEMKLETNQQIAAALELSYQPQAIRADELSVGLHHGLFLPYDDVHAGVGWAGTAAAQPWRLYKARLVANGSTLIELELGNPQLRHHDSFHGLVIVRQSPRAHRGVTLLTADDDRAPLIASRKMQRDGQLFEKLTGDDLRLPAGFAIWTTDPTEARGIANLLLLNGLSALQERFGKDQIRLLFERDKVITTLASVDFNFAPSAINPKDDLEMIANTIHEVMKARSLAQFLT
jgi:hypothetical protein